MFADTVAKFAEAGVQKSRFLGGLVTGAASQPIYKAAAVALRPFAARPQPAE